MGLDGTFKSRIEFQVFLHTYKNARNGNRKITPQSMTLHPFNAHNHIGLLIEIHGLVAVTKLDTKSSANSTSTKGRISNQTTSNQTRQPNCKLSELSHPSFGDPATEDFPNIQKTTSSTANVSNKSQSSTIASDLQEELCMVTAESLQGRAFQEELETIAARLLPNHDFVNEPLHFRLLDIDQANACYLVNSSPPIFCFTRGLLSGEQSVKSVDELAFVLAHKLAHYQIRKEYDNEANSKLEEGLADALAIKAIHQAGYSPLAGLNFIQVNMSHPNRISQFLEGLMDPHPSDLIRISVIEAALTELYINNQVRFAAPNYAPGEMNLGELN